MNSLNLWLVKRKEAESMRTKLRKRKIQKWKSANSNHCKTTWMTKQRTKTQRSAKANWIKYLNFGKQKKSYSEWKAGNSNCGKLTKTES
jgi:hypothetical protein